MNLPITFTDTNANLSAYALVGAIAGQPGHSTNSKALPVTKRTNTVRDVRNACSPSFYKGASHAR